MRVQNEMATRISIDAVGATHSLKGLSDAVRGATNEWKAQVAYQNSVGNSLGAVQAKYEGLGNAIDQQKNKINELRNRQKELNVTNTESVEKYQKYQTEIDKLRAEQTKLDTSTQEGKDRFAELSRQIDDTRESQSKNTGITQKDAEQYLKLNKQINQSENQLRSYEAQQKRAGEVVKYHESGLASLQKSYKSNEAVSKSFTERLKAEGKGASATVAEYKHLQSSLKNLKSQYDIQEKELRQIEKASGKTSEAYKKQAIRLNKTGKSIAETESKTKSMRSEFAKLQPTGINRIDSAVVKVKNHTGSMAEHAKASFAKFKNAALGASVAAGALAAGMLKGAKMASSLQNTYNENTNLLVTSGEKTKAVMQEIAEMQKQGKKYSIQYSESQHNIATGYQELIKRGYDGAQSLGSMKSILQASKASGDDFSDTMQVTTSTLEAFGMRTNSTTGMMKNTKLVANQLAMAADATSTDFKSLGVGMNYVGTSAHTAGLSLAQTSSAMGVLSNSGLEAQQAGTGLRKILISLKTPTDNGADAFKKYGMSIADFKDKSGKLKPVGDIFEEIGKKVPKGEQANFFHNVFGTTGQNAAAILATNTGELKKVNEQVEGAYKNNYVGKLADKNMKSTQNSVKRFKEAANAVLIEMGTAMMPALSKAAKGMAKAFNNPDVQKGLKVIAKGIGTVADKTVDFVIWIGKHSKDVKTWGEVLLAAFAGKKIIDGVSWLIKSMGTIKGLFGGIADSAGKGAISGEMESISSSAKSANGSASGLLGKLGKMPSSLKLVSGAMAALPAAIDIGGQISQTINTPSTKNKIALASKSLGTGIGAAAGFAIGGPIGAGIGASIGDKLGSTKVAQSIVKKLKNGLDKALNGTKVKAPKIDTKDAESSIKKAAKKYEQQQLEDLKNLHKTGNLSDKEYLRRVASVKKAYSDQKAAIEKGEKSNNIVAKYYAQQKQKIDTDYNKKRKSIHTKYDAEIQELERQGAINSTKYKKLVAARDEALDKASSKHKKQISDLNLKYATTDMSKEAKAHLTLNGKIKSATISQEKILKGLRDTKKKYSDSQLKTTVLDAEKEYTRTTKLADQRYNKIAKAADKQRAKVANAADRQYKAAKKAAEDQYNKTVDAANRQYKGHGAAAEKQRKAVISKATDQKNKSIEAASNQRKKIIDHADKQRANVVDKATKEHDDTIDKANNQKKQIEDAARKRSKSVTNHAVKQANNSMSAASKQGKGEQGIWGGILSVVNSIFKFFGMKKLSMHKNSFDYTPATTHGGYATGGAISKGGMALVGEAGPELRYTPYSGMVDIVGRHGAQFVPVDPGQEILNATDTAKVIAGSYQGSLPGYVNGNISLDGFLKAAKSGTSKLWDNVKELSSRALSVLKSPVKYFTDLVQKDIGKVVNVKDAHSTISDVAKASFKVGIKGIGDRLKDLYKKYDDNFGSAGGFGDAGGVFKGNLKATVKRALKANGLSTSGAMIAKILRQINTESGGRPHAVQPGADPDGDGSGPAMGLMQTKRSTFQANAFPGHKNIFKAYDNLLAALHYAKDRYGSSLSFLGNGHGYANGGIVSSENLYHLAEGNKPEYIIPTDISKRPRAWSLLKEVVEQFAGESEMNSQGVSQYGNFTELKEELEQVNNKFDKLLSLFGIALGLSQKQIDVVKNIKGYDKLQQYKEQAVDQNNSNWQAI